MTRAVTVLGLGSIGLPVATALSHGEVPGLSLHSVAASTPDRARRKLALIGSDVPVIGLSEVEMMGEVVVECLPPALFAATASSVIASGRTLMAASVGGLLRHPEILRQAETGPGRIVIPSGALGGLDAVRAIARHPEAGIRLVSAKPVTGFEQSAYLTDRKIVLSDLTGRTCIFDGPAEEGVRHFPKNVNVVAALALAGIGPARTRLSLWADPALTTNTHRVEARSPMTSFTAEIANLPDPENPKTSAITAHSLIAGLSGFARGWQFV